MKIFKLPSEAVIYRYISNGNHSFKNNWSFVEHVRVKALECRSEGLQRHSSLYL